MSLKTRFLKKFHGATKFPKRIYDPILCDYIIRFIEKELKKQKKEIEKSSIRLGDITAWKKFGEERKYFNYFNINKEQIAKEEAVLNAERVWVKKLEKYKKEILKKIDGMITEINLLGLEPEILAGKLSALEDLKNNLLNEEL